MATNTTNYLFLFVGEEDSEKTILIRKFANGRQETDFTGLAILDEHEFSFNAHINILIYNIKDSRFVENRNIQAKGIFFCYNAYSRESYDKLKTDWIPILKGKALHYFLVARRSLPDPEQEQEVAVPLLEGAEYARENGFLWLSEQDDVDRIMWVNFKVPPPTENSPAPSEDEMGQPELPSPDDDKSR